MLLQALLFAIGLVALYYGAEWLVRGGARLAGSFGVSPLVVGLTVISFGTSAPELVVSTLAAFRGQSDVAVGNVVGSNIVNVALILGVTALITPLRVEMRLLRREVPIMIVAMILPLLMALNGAIGRVDGALLLVGLAGYLWFVMRAAREEPSIIQAEFEEFEAAEHMDSAGHTRLRDAVLIVVGIAGLVIGAQLLVGAALFFARAFGVSELVIGLTVVSIGTSLPELATSVVAAIRKEADIAVGNVVGSNIFNAFAILGIATVIEPVSVAPSLIRQDMPIMILFAVVLVPLAIRQMRIGRLEGGLLAAGYVAYTLLLINQNAGVG